MLRVVVFAGGVYLIVLTLLSAIRTFILPRAVVDPISRACFRLVRALFELRTDRMASYLDRDRVFSYYAPVTLVLLPFLWLSMAMAGYTLMLWAIHEGNVWNAFRLSGSSILTLGFASSDAKAATLIEYSAAALGLLLVAVLISYLPTIYSAYSSREHDVALLMVRAGTPPSAPAMIELYNRLGALDQLQDIWENWERWFATLGETHTSLAVLNFYRSPRPDYTWVTAAGTVLDAGSLLSAAIDVPRNPQRELCIRSGFLALRDIARFFAIEFDEDPSPDGPISIGRDEFDDVVAWLAAAGVAMKADPDQAWADFVGWRVNYDRVLLILAELTMSPPTQWISDRSLARRYRPPIFGGRRIKRR